MQAGRGLHRHVRREGTRQEPRELLRGRELVRRDAARAHLCQASRRGDRRQQRRRIGIDGNLDEPLDARRKRRRDCRDFIGACSATASMLATDNAEPVAAASATRPASAASRRPTSTLTGQGDAAVAPTAAASAVASESRSAGRMSRPSIHDIGPA